MKKILSLLLAMIMIFAMLACSKKDDDSGKTTGNNANVTSPENEDPLYADPKLPSKKIGGEMVFLTREDWHFREIGVEEDSSEVVTAAVYRRDMYLEEKYGVDLKILMKPNVEIASFASNETLVGALSFDVILAGFNSTFHMLVGDVLIDFSQVPHINTEKAYWNKSMLDSTTVANKAYMLVSAANIQTFHGASCVFVNTGLYADLDFEKGIYDLVRDEEWTIDKMAEISKRAYYDVDGSQSATVGDRFGSCSSLAACEGMFSGMGGKYVEKNNSDIPEFIPFSEKTNNIITKLVSFWADDTSLLINRYKNSDEVFVQTISSGNLLFMQEQMYQYGAFNRYCEYEVGVLPMPKYDETQEDYKTYTHINWSSTTSVPRLLSSERLDQVGAILEDMAYLSERDIFPAYYEVNMKGRNAQDEESIEMLDIIFSTLDVDFGNVLAGEQFDATYVLRDLVEDKSTDITAKFEEKAPIYAAYVKNLVNKVTGTK